MRTLAFGLVVVGTALALAVGCGESDSNPGAEAAAGSATAGSGTNGAGTSGKAGGSATAGSVSGGSSSGGGPAGGNVAGGASHAGSTTGGQPNGQAGAGNEGGAASGLVDCDPKKILCKRLAPECAAGEVPSVAGSCYGDCVKVAQCACSAADQCPQPNEYTCWAKQHCGPFVE
jgi:hypothetical protein